MPGFEQRRAINCQLILLSLSSNLNVYSSIMTFFHLTSATKFTVFKDHIDSKLVVLIRPSFRRVEIYINLVWNTYYYIRIFNQNKNYLTDLSKTMVTNWYEFLEEENTEEQNLILRKMHVVWSYTNLSRGNYRH